MEFNEKDVMRAKKGNKEAFVKIIKASEGSMYRVAKSIVHSDVECADAIQETILKAYQSIQNLKNNEYFKTWLIRILINECNKIVKQNKRVIPMESFKENSGKSHIHERLEIQEAIGSLEDELRTIVTLYYIEDLPLKEIANILDIPEGTVKSRLSRAREKLMLVLENHEIGGHYHGNTR